MSLRHLIIGSWTWFSVVVTIIILRLISRTLHLKSVRRLQLDDHLMILVLAFYIVETVAINIAGAAPTNLIPPDYLNTHQLSPSEVSSREYGSKFVLVVEQCQCAIVWLCKACLAIMYLRITSGLPRQHLAAKILAGYIACTFVLMEILYLGVWCRPFHNYWAVPTPNVQCSAATHHLIVNTTFNLSSDAAMLLIGIPLFIRTRLPIRRKLILTCVFGLGFFNITCAILNKYYSFTKPFGDDWVYWYIREAATAVIVANLPFMWTLLRRTCGLRAWVINANGKRTSLSRTKSSTGSSVKTRSRSLPWMAESSIAGTASATATATATATTALSFEDIMFDNDFNGGGDIEVANENGPRSWWRSTNCPDEEDAIPSLRHVPSGTEIYKTVRVSVTMGTEAEVAEKDDQDDEHMDEIKEAGEEEEEEEEDEEDEDEEEKEEEEKEDGGNKYEKREDTSRILSRPPPIRSYTAFSLANARAHTLARAQARTNERQRVSTPSRTTARAGDRLHTQRRRPERDWHSGNVVAGGHEYQRRWY